MCGLEDCIGNPVTDIVGIIMTDKKTALYFLHNFSPLKKNNLFFYLGLNQQHVPCAPSHFIWETCHWTKEINYEAVANNIEAVSLTIK